MSAAAQRSVSGLNEETATQRKDHRASEIGELKARDNFTNIRFIAFVYAVLIASVGGTIWSYTLVAEAGLPWWYNIPATILAVVVNGAVQHQFGGIIHEGTHYTLFANRKLNELVSDWLAAFPIYTSTYAFRLHHFSHHQFVNDPERDSNFAQAKDSGHWLDFPLTHMELLAAIFRQLNPIRLASYILARARYSALGVDSNPYADSERRGSPWFIRIGVLYAAGVPAVVIPLINRERWDLAIAFLSISWVATIAYYWFAPEKHIPKNRLDPVISERATALSRISFMALLYSALTFGQYVSQAPFWHYFGLLWILPLFTTFPLFMILREWVQHGNADRGRYTNSRIFLVNPLVRFAIFPFGMDYHLPHHLYASVPHYKLKRLHQFMLRDPQYVEKARIVEGWSIPGRNRLPTIVDVLGHAYAPKNEEIHVDNTTLELADVNDKAAIQRHVEASLKQQPRT
jgi:fatty acid desaturase